MRFIESKHIEYKRELSEALEKEVVAFLNTGEGGVIYIGIDAKTQMVTGLIDADKTQLQIKDRIKTNIAPSALGLFDVLLEKIDAKQVIKITVAGGYEKPYHIKKYGMSEKGCFIRIGSASEPMNTKMIEELFFKRARNTLGMIRSPKKGLSFEQLKIFYQEAGFKLNDNFTVSLELLTPDSSYNYAAYLLADKNGTSIKVAKYKGTNRVDLIENNEYGYCSLVKAAKQVLDKLEVENKTFTKITSKQRLQKRMIDETALREAVINAIVHNDYSYEAPPKFELFSDRLEITSTGGLPFGLSREDFFSGVSVPRNKELMRVFKDLELVEYLGSGIPRILQKYDTSVFHFTENFLRIVYQYEEGFAESPVLTTQGLTDEGVSEGVSEGVKTVLAFIRTNTLCRVPAIAKGTGMPEKTVERHIRRLKEQGKIEFTGAPKTGGYRLIAGEE
jgi:predicted HTH transcriptional regulator